MKLPTFSKRDIKWLLLIAIVTADAAFAYVYWPRQSVHRIGSSAITETSAVMLYTSEDGEWQFSAPVNFKEFKAPPQPGDRIAGYWTKRK